MILTYKSIIWWSKNSIRRKKQLRRSSYFIGRSHDSVKLTKTVNIQISFILFSIYTIVCDTCLTGCANVFMFIHLSSVFQVQSLVVCCFQRSYRVSLWRVRICTLNSLPLEVRRRTKVNFYPVFIVPSYSRFSVVHSCWWTSLDYECASSVKCAV